MLQSFSGADSSGEQYLNARSPRGPSGPQNEQLSGNLGDDSTSGGSYCVSSRPYYIEGRICECLNEWSGLSESNRHLNLGKVPYYHYTKAATNSSFIARLLTNLKTFELGTPRFS